MKAKELVMKVNKSEVELGNIVFKFKEERPEFQALEELEKNRTTRYTLGIKDEQT